MREQKDLVQLNVFLIKASYSTPAEVLNVDECDDPIDVPIAGHGKGKLYIKHTTNVLPKWSAFFEDRVDPRRIRTATVSAAFVLRIDDRLFVLTFGQGGRFLLKQDVYEERFGLHTTLNIVSKESIRVVDKQTLDSIQSHTRIQSGQETSASEFGLDVEQDILKAIVGMPQDTNLGTRVTGSDSLSVIVRARLSDLPALLSQYRQKFESDLSSPDYRWVNNLAMVRNTSSTVALLEAKLNQKLQRKDYTNLWLSIPEIIDWRAVKGFIFTNGRRALHHDITLDKFLATVDQQTSITVDLSKLRKVFCADADHNLIGAHWSVYKCLYAEIEHHGHKYILNDGSWFSVALSFVKKTDSDFRNLGVSKLELPICAVTGEGEYNATVATAYPNRFQLFDDRHKIFHGGGHGQVEVCDLLSIDKELIHIKLYGKSSVFSHLFSQGFVSGQLIQTDSEFRAKIAARLKGPFAGLIKADAKPKDEEFTVVYGVISDSEGDGLHLPFFSRVNINNTARILRGFGYRVELLR
jgi:uncharacterized protein (TIGR04141 family)